MDCSTQALSMRPKFLASAFRQTHEQRKEVVAADRRVVATETAHHVWIFIHAIAKAANDSAQQRRPLSDVEFFKNQYRGRRLLEHLVRLASIRAGSRGPAPTARR